MKIIYPPLVEQAYNWMKGLGMNVTKAEVYQVQVKEGFLTETGEPTQKALDEALVKSYQQKHSRLIDFKQEYPVFVEYPTSEFTQQDGIWYVSQKILDHISEWVEQDILDFDQSQQIVAYMGYRNYDNPHTSIAEMKGHFHPWYTKYDDLQFQMLPTGEIGISKSVIEDMAYRSEIGELDLEVEKLNSVLKSMED